MRVISSISVCIYPKVHGDCRVDNQTVAGEEELKIMYTYVHERRPFAIW